MWVSAQRRQYKLLKENKPSSMTIGRAKALDDIDFEWEGIRGHSDDERWQRRYEELKEFKARTGHCRVPQKYNANKALGKWVSNQRTQYKLYLDEKASNMTIERAKALDDIGFEWDVTEHVFVSYDERWQRRYEELKELKARTGHCRVPQKYNANKALGTWVSDQRQHYKLYLDDKPSNMRQPLVHLVFVHQHRLLNPSELPVAASPTTSARAPRRQCSN
jgi:hypothetical protein